MCMVCVRYEYSSVNVLLRLLCRFTLLGFVVCCLCVVLGVGLPMLMLCFGLWVFVFDLDGFDYFGCLRWFLLHIGCGFRCWSGFA